MRLANPRATQHRWGMGCKMRSVIVSRGPSDPLAALSDDFSSGSSIITERGWSVYKPTALVDPPAVSEVFTGPGYYRMTPTRGGGTASPVVPDASFWFNGINGSLVYKEVSGDCDMRTRATIWNVTFDGLPGALNFRLGGIAIHSPIRTPFFNYVHEAAGVAGGAYSFETKDTVNSSSTFPTVVAATSLPWIVDLRIIRVGSLITTLYRNAPGATPLANDAGWSTQQSIDRPDLPVLCQWGMHVYSNVINHDIGLDYHQVLFSTP